MLFKKILTMTLCMLSGVLLFASQQNGAQQVSQLQENSVSVDIAAQLEASDNAEVQEKNAMAILQWAQREMLKAYSIVNVRYEINNKQNVVLKFGADFNKQIIAQIQNTVKQVILKNGFKNIGSQRYPFERDGALIAFPLKTYDRTGTYASDYEYYNNPNALLFFYNGGYGRDEQLENHPQNIKNHLAKKITVKVLFERKNGKQEIIGSWDVSNSVVPYMTTGYKPKSRATTYCSIGFRTDLGGSQRSNFLGYEWTLNLSPDLLTDETNNVIFNVEFVSPDGQVTTHTIAKKTLKTKDVTGQKDKQRTADQAVAQIISQAYRESFKNIKVNVKYNYNRLENKGKVEYSLQLDNAAYLQQMGKLKSQLEALGFKNLERQVYHNHDLLVVAARSTSTNGWWIGKVKDHYMLYMSFNPYIKKLVNDELNKYRYFVKIKLKDSANNVLTEIEIPLDNKTREGSFTDFNGVYMYFHRFYTKDLRQYQSPGWIITINQFNNPEDAKKVTNMEYIIEEKIIQ